MKSQNLLFFSLPLIFLLGFLAGSYWQATIFRTAYHVAPTSVAGTVSPATAEEEKLTKALEDPDFKRVHDFLIRETPMQMNLDLSGHSTDKTKTEKE